MRRLPELALVDELAHTNAPGSAQPQALRGHRQILAAGIDVISTVNVQHLESLNDLVFEMTGVRVRETFPTGCWTRPTRWCWSTSRPRSCATGSGPARCTRPGGSTPRSRTSSGPITSASLRQLALREVAEDVEARRAPRHRRPARPPGDLDRILVLVEPAAGLPAPAAPGMALRAAAGRRASTRSRCIRPAERPVRSERVALAALRRLAVHLGVHFLEEEDRDLSPAVARVGRRPRHHLRILAPRTSGRSSWLGRRAVPAARGAPGVDVRPGCRPRQRTEQAVMRASAQAARADGGATGGCWWRSPAASSTRSCCAPRCGSPGRRMRPRAGVSDRRAAQHPLDSPLVTRSDVRCRSWRRSSRRPCGPGVPVDARLERGRSLRDALARLWTAERFQRVVIPATTGAGAGSTSTTWPGSSPMRRPRRWYCVRRRRRRREPRSGHGDGCRRCEAPAGTWRR